jgi:hypothetical protein
VNDMDVLKLSPGPSTATTNDSLLSPWRRRKSVIRKSSFAAAFGQQAGSPHSSTKTATPRHDLSASTARKFTRKALTIDRNFVNTAVILVPESMKEFDDSELANFKSRLQPGMWIDLDVAEYLLGCALHIFPDTSYESDLKWVFFTDNELNHKLITLLALMAAAPSPPVWCEMNAFQFRLVGEMAGSTTSGSKEKMPPLMID